MIAAISIGNSDNKLTQQEFNKFVADVDGLIQDFEIQRHFFGGSVTWAKWQNICWLFEFDVKHLTELQNNLKVIREFYNQDSIFILTGEGTFI